MNDHRNLENQPDESAKTGQRSFKALLLKSKLKQSCRDVMGLLGGCCTGIDEMFIYP